MILECIRMVTDALQDVTIGINVQLPLVSKDGTDTTPPPIVSFLDETRNAEVAFGRVPTQPINLPALIITADGESHLHPAVESGVRDGDVTLLIRYVCKNVNTNSAYTDTYYTLRALQMFLNHFTANSNNPNRIRNNVEVIQSTTFGHSLNFENIHDALVTGGMRVGFLVRDITP